MSTSSFLYFGTIIKVFHSACQFKPLQNRIEFFSYGTIVIFHSAGLRSLY
jgi:hypothetical protein